MMEIEQLWTEIDRRAFRLGWENVTLDGACGRVLVREACSSADQPPFDQCAVDGYALANPAAELPTSPIRFPLAGERVAGQGDGHPLREGEAVRILTGAVVPEGTFAVVKQEDCTLSPDGNMVEISGGISQGMNIRARGGVFQKGAVVLEADTRISPGGIGLLAASGVGLLGVVRRPRVLHLVTGDEIIPSGETLKPGQIHDSNGPMIAALLRERGIPSKQITQVRLADSSGQIGGAVAAFNGDLLLISGGSGPGDRDHTLNVLEREGFKIHASRLNSRPGKPLIFATREHQIAFGLPGNPLSHFVCYHAFVRRALDRLEGIAPAPLLAAHLAGPIQDAGDGRRTWLPGILQTTATGNLIRPLEWKHSGDMTPLGHANALILLGNTHPADQSDVVPNSLVEVLCLP